MSGRWQPDGLGRIHILPVIRCKMGLFLRPQKMFIQRRRPTDEQNRDDDKR